MREFYLEFQKDVLVIEKVKDLKNSVTGKRLEDSGSPIIQYIM